MKIGEMEMPKHLEWMLSEEWRRVASEEIETAAGLIKVGADVFEKYGLIVSVEIKEVGAE